MRVDPVAGSAAGGGLQTAQRIGMAIGQATIGATFFAALDRGGYAHALRVGVGVGLAFLGSPPRSASPTFSEPGGRIQA